MTVGKCLMKKKADQHEIYMLYMCIYNNTFTLVNGFAMVGKIKSKKGIQRQTYAHIYSFFFAISNQKRAFILSLFEREKKIVCGILKSDGNENE